MIKLITILLFFICTSKCFGQIANRLAPLNSTVSVGSPTNFLWVKPDTSPTYQIYTSTWDSLIPLKNMRRDISARWDSVSVKSLMSSKSVTLALIGMSLTAGSNTVVIPTINTSTLTPMSRQISINGISHDLTTDASWSLSIPSSQTIQIENDPLWNGEKTNYYTKSNSDIRYLQSFTESDPTIPSYAKTLNNFSIIKNNTDAIYYPISGNPSGFLLSEVDGSTTNEIQALSGSGTNTLFLTSGGSWVMPSQTINNATLTVTGIITSTASGNSFSINAVEQDGVIGNEFQTISGNGTNTLTLSNNGGSWSLPAIISNTVSRVLNTPFNISSTQGHRVDYSIYCQISSALTGTNTADVYLEVSTSSGGTYTIIANSGVMAAGVLSTNGGSNVLSGYIPPGYWVRIRTSSSGINSGSSVFVYRYGRENNN